MATRGDGWWLATLAAGAAGVCFAVAGWGAAGRFAAGGADLTWGSARRTTPAELSDLPRPGVVTTTTAPTGGQGGATYADGTCLVIANPTVGDLVEVACEQPHHLEVAATVDLEAVGAAYPSAEAWATVDRSCLAVAEAYVGGPIGPDGAPALVAGAVRVPEEAWQAGARSTPCVVVEVDAAGGAVSRTGRLRR